MDNMTVSVLTMQWMDNTRLVGMQWLGGGSDQYLYYLVLWARGRDQISRIVYI